jgi:hypothetical protein
MPTYQEDRENIVSGFGGMQYTSVSNPYWSGLYFVKDERSILFLVSPVSL